jgi:hypothetical protein
VATLRVHGSTEFTMRSFIVPRRPQP